MLGLKIFSRRFFGSINIIMCFMRDNQGDRAWFPLFPIVFPMVSFGFVLG